MNIRSFKFKTKLKNNMKKISFYSIKIRFNFILKFMFLKPNELIALSYKSKYICRKNYKIFLIYFYLMLSKAIAFR